MNEWIIPEETELNEEEIAYIKGHGAVELIRCKDCKQNGQCSIQFKFADADDPGNWFCAYGKRKAVK